ncbi:hypothetical protein AVEN_213462-1 [Araneus ventricosus]|uniref:Peptidase A1 domain-containing protein n=1 Tax=Araneus ventricosus TaxID=182803 RepID=A0A4Y2GB20_ARAVE|nr:hypothetical protein AVEN_232447-1 [Araneus ventricosus]GBM50880.1 hypothetical protein AVEN_65805-1 [Araneus ventricosus]GBM50915.1 hypothetical protein AVEN_183132-1 [Araneus ventricosus]GBM50919.1 hypothetical protein AVEN_213462-1 [Araneus ventricosus]
MFSEKGPTLKTADGKTVATSGRCVLKIDLNGNVGPFEFLVLPECSHQMILGWDFFRATDAVIDCGKEEIQFADLLAEDTETSESECSLFAATNYVIEANAIKQI